MTNRALYLFLQFSRLPLQFLFFSQLMSYCYFFVLLFFWHFFVCLFFIAIIRLKYTEMSDRRAFITVVRNVSVEA